jgi:hypothetical protein
MNIGIELLPDDIKEIILNNITFYKDIYTFLLLNKYCYNYYIEKYKNFRADARSITQDIPDSIISITGNIYDYTNLPEIEYKDSFIGIANKIDYIFPEHMKYPIMRGITNQGLTFICFKFQLYLEPFHHCICCELESKVNNKITVIIYERYKCCTSTNKQWDVGSPYVLASLINNSSYFFRDIILQYKNLVAGEKIKYGHYLISIDK